MDALTILAGLLMRGVTAVVRGGNLHVSPRHLLTDADRAALRAHKPQLLGLLSSPMIPAALPPEWRELWEERAAIMEYDGGLPREQAEAQALADIARQVEQPRVEMAPSSRDTGARSHNGHR